MQDHENGRLEKMRERLERDNPGTDRLRKTYFERLKSQVDAFYQRESLADLAKLCSAVERLANRRDSAEIRAHVLELMRFNGCFAGLKGIDDDSLD